MSGSASGQITELVQNPGAQVLKLSYHASTCLKEVNPSPSGGVRPWSAAVFAVDERSGPEEVDSGGLESRAEGDILESSDPEMLDSGFPVILGHGGLDSGPEPIELHEQRSRLESSAPGVSELFAVVAEPMPSFAFKHRALTAFGTGRTG